MSFLRVKRSHASSGEPDDRGFTIVELLVVLLVLALLSAIAIPTFLHQRERAYEAQAETALKHAASAMESYATRSNGKYSGATIATLRADEGLRIPAGVTMSLPQGYQSATSYCFEAIHAGLPASLWHYAQVTGAPQPGSCLIPPD